MTEFIYSVDADGRTPLIAAAEFARYYFDEPREIESTKKDGSDLLFWLKRGLRIYRVTHSPATDKRPAIYQIAVERNNPIE